MKDDDKLPVVAYLADQKRQPDHNRQTRWISALTSRGGDVDFEAAFARHYAEFASILRDVEEPGVAIVAINHRRDQLSGVAYSPARATRPQSMVVGRHSMADLLLSDDAAISLRQFIVIVEPKSEFCSRGRGITYQVLDLRSRRRFRTEESKEVSGIRSDGAAFLACGDYLFLFFVIGNASDWPTSAQAAWASIPERIHLEERMRPAEGSGLHDDPPRPSWLARRPITRVSGLSGPRAGTSKLVRDDEKKVAELILEVPGTVSRLPVGEDALLDGILLGRSERCDGALALQSESLSRVHLLLLEVAGEVYAIDTASTNGCYLAAKGSHPFRLREIKSGEPLYLATTARVTWQWAN